jgi:hypothetical protein
VLGPLEEVNLNPVNAEIFRTVVFNLGYSKTSWGSVKLKKYNSIC